MMSAKSSDPAQISAVPELAGKVRQSSRSGSLALLADLWPGTEERFLEYIGTEAGCADIAWIRESGRLYLYSKRHMTAAYAESAALACGDSRLRLIAETVRRDSRTYPRPTPAAVFRESPFGLPQDAIDKAIEEILSAPDCGDILSLKASDGSYFLFSAAYLDPALAASLAEWMAVGQQQNP